MGKEAKVGLLVLVAGCMLYFGYHLLRGNDVFTKDNFFYVRYDNINGLQVSNPVTYRGVKVGQVEEIQMQYNENNSILVRLRVNPEIPVGDSTKAILESAGLLSGMRIKLALGQSSKMYEGDEELISVVDGGMLEKIASNTEGLQSLAIQIGEFSDKENATRVQLGQMLANLDTTLSSSKDLMRGLDYSFNSSNGNIKQVIAKLDKLLAEAETVPGSLNKVLAKADLLMDSLNQVKFKELADNVTASMKNIEGITAQLLDTSNTVGALLTEKDMYDNLNRAITDLDFVLVDFQANPSKYIQVNVFGKQPENEKPIIKSINPKTITKEIELKLKREVPAKLTAALYDMANKKVYKFAEESISIDRGSKKVTLTISPDVPKGDYVLHLEWLGAPSGESQNITIE